MSLEKIIEQAFENRAEYSPSTMPQDVKDAVNSVLEQLDNGSLRVAEKKNGEWTVNQWAKKAVLLSFRLNYNYPMQTVEHLQFYDKVPPKFATWTEQQFAESGVRV